MGNGNVLSFDFDKVTSGLNANDIPVEVPLSALVNTVELKEFNGVQKFVFNHTIFIDPNDESKTVSFNSFIGPNHAWLLAQYLEAVGQDFRSLTGVDIDEDTLTRLLVDEPLTIIFRDNEYNGKKNKQVKRVSAGGPS